MKPEFIFIFFVGAALAILLNSFVSIFIKKKSWKTIIIIAVLVISALVLTKIENNKTQYLKEDVFYVKPVPKN